MPTDLLSALSHAGDVAPAAAAVLLAVVGLGWGATRIARSLRFGRPAKVIGTVGHRKIGISVRDSTMHVHVVGQTGTGKSTLLVHLALQDVRAGRAVAMVDPVGDISADFLAVLPPGAEDRLCVIDASDKDWAVGLDLLRGDPELVGEHLDGLFARLFPDSWRAKQQVWLRRAILTLAGTGATLVDVPRLFAEAEFRARTVQALEGADHAIRRLVAEWKAYDEMSATARAQAAGPLAGKLDLLLLRASVLHILGQPTDRDPLELLDRGGIVILRAPQGQIGESAASLLSTAFVALVWDHMRARARTSKRPPVTLIVDECQMAFSARSLIEMLDLGRKWGLCAVLANQYLGQLGAPLGKAIAANCRTKIVFQVSDEDAWTLGGPSRGYAALGADRLGGLPVYQAAVRSRARPPVVVKTRPPARGSPDRARAARDASRRRWGRSRRDVEALLSGIPSGLQGEKQNAPSDLLQYGTKNGDEVWVKKDIHHLHRLLTERDLRVLRRIVGEGQVLGPVLRAEEFKGDSALAARRLARLLQLELVEKARAGPEGGRSPLVWAATEKGREVAGVEET